MVDGILIAGTGQNDLSDRDRVEIGSSRTSGGRASFDNLGLNQVRFTAGITWDLAI
jgi:hypothetical protein